MAGRRYRFLIAVVLLMLCLAVTGAGCGARTANDVNINGKAGVQQNGGSEGETAGTPAVSLTDNATLEESAEKNQDEPFTAASKKAGAEQQTTSISTNVEKGEREAKPPVGTVNLYITRDFGQTILLEKNIELPRDGTVLDILRAACDIKTAYGGGLIIGINGLESKNRGVPGGREDWFYFVNGICADVGAGEYRVGSGDKVWWDYHEWDAAGLVNSAVIGSFPEPFVRGYRGQGRPAVILYTADCSDLGEALKKSLKTGGASSIKGQLLDADVLEVRSGPTVVVGEWKDLKEIPYLQRLNQAYKKNGTYVHFLDDGLELLDRQGRPAQVVTRNAGIIAATGEGLGDTSPLWLVAGVDRAGLEAAVAVLIEYPHMIRGLYSAAVVDNDVVRLPLPKGAGT